MQRTPTLVAGSLRNEHRCGFVKMKNGRCVRQRPIIRDGNFETGVSRREFRGGGDGIRTHYLLDATEALYQVSYAPEGVTQTIARR